MSEQVISNNYPEVEHVRSQASWSINLDNGTARGKEFCHSISDLIYMVSNERHLNNIISNRGYISCEKR